jgi:hypothetical protein
VAGENDRHGVAVECSADGTRRAGLADAAGESSVCRHLAVRDAGELVEHAALEGRHRGDVDGDVEGRPGSGEILVELALHRHESPGHTQQPAAEVPGEPVERLFRRELDPAHSAVGGRDEQLADGRVGGVVGGVEQPGG